MLALFPETKGSLIDLWKSHPWESTSKITKTFRRIRPSNYDQRDYPETLQILKSLKEKKRHPLNQLGVSIFQPKPLVFEPYSKHQRRVYPFTILTTQPGRNLLSDLDLLARMDRFLDFDDYPNASLVSKDSHALGKTVRIHHGQQPTIYVKKDDKQKKFPGASLFEFLGNHLLSLRGVHTAPQLLATNWGTITTEVNGKPITQKWYLPDNHLLTNKAEIFTNEVNAIKKNLAKEGLWWTDNFDGWFNIDLKPAHLFPRDLDSQNPLDWFTVIDAVAYGFSFDWL